MAMLGFLGLNKPIDLKNSYEIIACVDQDIESSATKAKMATEQYFEEQGISAKDYAYQSMHDGKFHVYKFNDKVNVDTEAMLNYVKNAVNNQNVVIEIKYNQVEVNDHNQGGWLALALGITAVVTFLYLIIMEKFASALSVFVASIVGTLVFVALTAITRIPAAPYFEIVCAGAFVFTAILSTVMANRFKEETQNVANQGSSVSDIADKSATSSAFRFAVLVAGSALLGALLAIFGCGYLAFLGGQIAIAAISAGFTAFTVTPILWAWLKKGK